MNKRTTIFPRHYQNVPKVQRNSESELFHYGILGQKRGVRNYEGYDGRLTPEGIERYSKYYKRKKKSGSSEKEGGVLLEMALVTLASTALVLPDAIALLKDKKAKDEYQAEQYTKPETLIEMKRYEPIESINETYKKVNPKYPNYGTDMNCVFCSLAMEMRQRGYDVKARLSDTPMYMDLVMKDCFKGAKKDKFKPEKLPVTKDKVSMKAQQKQYFEQLKKYILSSYGKNSSGAVSLAFLGANVGHAIYFKADGNDVYFYDGQSKRRNPKEVERMMSICDYNNLGLYRLDNLEPTDIIGNAVISYAN